METIDVLVIGAGISGLAAASKLIENGREVLVFEAEDIPGGRVNTRQCKSFQFDNAAQFFLPGYKCIRHEAKKNNIQLVKMPHHSVDIIYKNRHIKFNRHIFSDLRKLNDKTIMRILLKSPEIIYKISRIDLTKFTQKLKEEGVSSEDYICNNIGKDLAEFVDPIFTGLSFQHPNEISFYDALAILRLGIGFEKPVLLNCNGGIGELPNKMAESIPIQYRHRAVSVERVKRKIRIKVQNGSKQYEIWAKKVIFAIPGNILFKILRTQLPYEKRFFPNIRYSSTYSIHFWTEKNLLPNTQGALFSEDKNHFISSLIEAYKQEEKGFFYNLLLHNNYTNDLKHKDDPNSHIASLLSEYTKTKYKIVNIKHWAEALPVFYPGYRKLLNEFQKDNGKGNIAYCGDYSYGPCIEFALRSGLLAARLV